MSRLNAGQSGAIAPGAISDADMLMFLRRAILHEHNQAIAEKVRAIQGCMNHHANIVASAPEFPHRAVLSTGLRTAQALIGDLLDELDQPRD
jgi:hypothetical protein